MRRPLALFVLLLAGSTAAASGAETARRPLGLDDLEAGRHHERQVANCRGILVVFRRIDVEGGRAERFDQPKDDAYGTLAQIRGIAERLPATQLLELPDCGHSPHRDQPQQVITATRTFIHQRRQA